MRTHAHARTPANRQFPRAPLENRGFGVADLVADLVSEIGNRQKNVADFESTGKNPHGRLLLLEAPTVDHPTDTPPRFIAWTRTPPSRVWVRTAEGATEAEAHARVFQVPGCGMFRDVCVLPEGRTPFDGRPNR